MFPPSETPIPSLIHTSQPGTPQTWMHCEISPQGKRDLAGAVLLGVVLGVLLCAIPFMLLLRRVRRLMRRGSMRASRHGGGSGRWKVFKEPRGFPEYETEYLLKQEYEAPLDF
ncbi:hypothetical protein B0H19DRAFT_1267334 [Mycena capillaripes]|nr:hypothetical protein B0H19DRAFT_1267334 [Mycena capillaripes]